LAPTSPGGEVGTAVVGVGGEVGTAVVGTAVGTSVGIAVVGSVVVGTAAPAITIVAGEVFERTFSLA
jgi:hypothetical protein